MTSNTKIKFSVTKQNRSKTTLNNIFESAEKLLDEGDPNKFNARELARKSGYALGTMANRLLSIENVFISIIEKRRDKILEKLCKHIQDTPKKKTINEVATDIIDKSFESINNANPKIIRFLESRLIKKNLYSSSYNHFIDIVSDSFFKVYKKNTSKTFGSFTKHEVTLFTRALMTVAERPIVEGYPIAGTAEHKKICIKCFVRLFGK